jgi:putative CocE/NonD family hydrolase
VVIRRLLGLCLLGIAWAGLPAPAGAWTPEPPSYGIAKQTNVPVTMSDGTVLRADIYTPTDPTTGQPAKGPFPVIMVQTPYGKNTVGAASGMEGGGEAATQTAEMPYLIQRGYIDVVAEVRGTGDSGGTFNLLDPVQGRDGAELVRWAAALPHSDGRVGLYGPSYMGYDQFMTANALGPGSPLRAMFPIINGNDPYRDFAFEGGLFDAEGDIALFATVFGPLEELNPLAENPTNVGDLISVERQHAPALLSYNAAQTANVETGGDQTFDEAYWQARSPRNMIAHVVADGIPAFMIGGWFDVFQRGEPLNYSGLQNVLLGRPVGAPMSADQPVSGRYQLLQGPWYHLDAGTNFDVYRVELAWFDRWLKGEATGIDQTSTPLHLYMLGANRWVDASRYPLPQATPHTYYLAGGPSASGAPSQNDGALVSSGPAGAVGADQVRYTGQSSPCDRQSEQYGFGALQLALEIGRAPDDPCTKDDRSLQTGPGALTYTTAPMGRDTVVAGPIDATIYASSTRPDTELVATVEDIAPDGTSLPLTSGALLGSFRALDPTLSWLAPDGRPLLPYHPYTKASVTAVPVGAVTRYDIEVFPTLADIAKGHRVRLTLTTSDIPHLLPSTAQALNLAGGVYEVQRHAGAASYIELPLAAPDAFSTSTLLAAASPPSSRRAAGRCASRRRFRIHIRPPRGVTYARAVVRVGARRLRVLRRGRGFVATVDLIGLRHGRYTVRITAVTTTGRKVRSARRYRTCTPKRRRHRRRR